MHYTPIWSSFDSLLPEIISLTHYLVHYMSNMKPFGILDPFTFTSILDDVVHYTMYEIMNSTPYLVNYVLKRTFSAPGSKYRME